MSDEPSNNNFDQKLQQFRHEIDAIDNELFQLILKRANIVKQVGELKEKNDDTHVKLRPAREARQLRAIYDKFKTSPFPEASALMIWRHLINGSLMIESPLRVVTLEAPQALPDYAREYFGCYADLTYMSTAEELVEALQTDRADIGIFPMPASDDRRPWWVDLAGQGSALKIFLKFPYLPTACVRDGTEALAVSKIADEVPNDHSHTVLLLQLAASVSPVEMKEVVTSLLDDVVWHASNKLEDESLACLVTVPYVLEKADPRLMGINQKLGSGKQIISIAGYFTEMLGQSDE